MKIALFLLLISACSFQVFPQYTIEVPISNLVQPVAFSFLPNNNVIITHKPGLVRIYSMDGSIVSDFWNFTDSCSSAGEHGALGICLDPNYATNHYIYIYYIHSNPMGIRIVRLTENNNVGTNPFIIYNYLPAPLTGFHVGGNVKFGADGKLYFSTGETAVSPNAQLLTNPLGKILRINSNGTIPTDNPFYDDGNPSTGNDDRIWAYGLRNSFDFCFSPVNDSLYATENGAALYDEVNFIRKGKNYGWPVCQGYCNPYNPLYQQPMHVWGVPIPALTGIMVYSGSVMPEFNGKLLVADNNFGKIYKCDLGDAPNYDTITGVTQVFDLDGFTTLLQGPDGFIYGLSGGYITAGGLYRIKPQAFGIKNNKNVADVFELKQNFPNPFNPNTKINYELKAASDVRLSVFDVTGKEIAVLINKKQNPGPYEVIWNAEGFSSGVYFYRISARRDGSSTEEFTDEKKMILIK
ncbi:MAG: T9SS C-terminal target domain-containing protein [Ignavibacteriae bacterium]|nr:MAG: T9SS C-terminal target domain-containing protein [Ignavibacteriota bacterium]